MQDYLRKKVCILLSVSLLASSAIAAGVDDGDGGASKSCDSVFQKYSQKASKTRRFLTYVSEVKNTYGRRIVSVKDLEVPSTDPNGPWFTPLDPNQKRGAGRRRAQYLTLKYTGKNWGKPYEFTPLKAIKELTWGAATESLFDVREKPTRLAKFSMATVLGLLVGWGFLSWASAKTADKFRREIRENPASYEFFLNYDYRCRAIKDDLDSGLLTLEEAREQVYGEVQVPYSMWFANRPFYIGRSTDYLRNTLINFALFAPFQEVVKKGVSPKEGFYTPPSALGPVSDGKLRLLVDAADELATKNEFITRFLHAPFNLEDDISERLFTDALKKDVIEDQTNQDFIALKDAGTIGLGAALYGIEENEAWKTEFKEFNILHVTRLRATPDGSGFTSTPLSLSEVQRQIKIDVLRRFAKKTS